MKLYIVRHAQTHENAAAIVRGGRAGGLLTERGAKQAKALKRLFSGEKIKTVYSSPQNRAATTARAIGKPVFVNAMKEMDFGRAEGMSHEHLEKAFPRIFDRIFENPQHPMPDGESLLDVEKRLQPFVASLLREKGNPTIVVVGHNVVNRVLLALLLKMPLKSCRIFKLRNASVALVDPNPRHARLYSLHNGFASIGKDTEK